MPKQKDKSIGSIIRHYRILNGITQEALSEKLNLSYQQIQRYEYNKSIPPLETLSNICKLLDIPIELFFKENLRHNILQKIETDIEKNHVLLNLIHENPELNDIITFYIKHKPQLKKMDLLQLLNDLINLPKDKNELYLKLFKSILGKS